MKTRRGFSLPELLISISIISLLVIIFIPSINRSLSKNNLANDVEVLSSKVESTRLLAGSTQQADSGTGYYGLYIPGGNGTSYEIVRLSSPAVGQSDFSAPCNSPDTFAANNCVVEQVNLSHNVELANLDDQIIVFASPTQQLYNAVRGSAGNPWLLNNPDSVNGWQVKLMMGTKTATVTVDGVSAKTKVSYSN